MQKKRKPLDSFKRTPMRRYDLPPQEETRVEHVRRFRKKHFDLPPMHAGLDRTLTVLLCAVMLLACAHAEVLLDNWDGIARIPGSDDVWVAGSYSVTIEAKSGQ